MLNETVIFRATDELAIALQQRANEAGLTVSEYLREIIASSVGVPEIVSPVCAKLAQSLFCVDEEPVLHLGMASAPSHKDDPDIDPIALLAVAGSGDTQAQRDLAEMAMTMALSGQPDVDPFTALSEGLIFARLADRHDVAGDTLRIVRMLALASMMATGSAARHLAAEAIARLELIANSSSDLANRVADLLASSIENEHPDTIRLAKEYRDRIRNARSDRRSTDDAS